MWRLVIWFIFASSSGFGSGSKSDPVIPIYGNATVLTGNGTFKLGFFRMNGDFKWYLGMWYASILAPTYVWVANREIPVKNLTAARFGLSGDGRLTVTDSGEVRVWQSSNEERGSDVEFLDTGNLILRSTEGVVVWQSFDFPTDTWLPGMNLTRSKLITCWRSLSDPSPGMYSLRLKPVTYGEFELVFNGSNPYWSTGNWTGEIFSGVPQMMIRYIYKFRFVNPFTPAASFSYTEMPLEPGLRPPLSRFQIDPAGQFRQYTWSMQTENWNMFWSQPENRCRVYGLCGNLGFCNAILLKPCQCLAGFLPLDKVGWDSDDFSGGCRRESDDICAGNDGFENVGIVGFDGAVMEFFSGSQIVCERSCLSNCSCIGLFHNQRTNMCKNLYGSLLNIRNLSSDGINNEVLFVRVESGGTVKKNKSKSMVVIIVSVVGFVTILGLVAIGLVILRKKKRRIRKEEEAVFPVTNLKVFSYKELHFATRGFSEKLGHGGFGAVFQGELSDNSIVAVKRLERLGNGEREFRAEVCTIGNIQHVNLVRLRGFCSENSHRLLVYDYMPNGPLSVFLRRDGPNMGWDVRFRVAIGTARGIAYLHEECRDCIIHCDIKPENILLDGDFMAKVSDFGLAKLIGRDFSRVLATMRGTWGYVAPEWISGVAITAKADVYSYGMTLLELIGGRRNVEAPPSGSGGGGAEAVVEEKWFFPPWAAGQIIEGNVAAVVDDRLAGAYDAVEAERLGLVAVWCIQDDEAARPTMGMVVKMLEGIVEVAVPPPPKLLQALVSGESFHGVVADSDQGLPAGGGGGSDEHQQVAGALQPSETCPLD